MEERGGSGRDGKLWFIHRHSVHIVKRRKGFLFSVSILSRPFSHLDLILLTGSGWMMRRKREKVCRKHRNKMKNLNRTDESVLGVCLNGILDRIFEKCSAFQQEGYSFQLKSLSWVQRKKRTQNNNEMSTFRFQQDRHNLNSRLFDIALAILFSLNTKRAEDEAEKSLRNFVKF